MFIKKIFLLHNGGVEYPNLIFSLFDGNVIILCSLKSQRFHIHTAGNCRAAPHHCTCLRYNSHNHSYMPRYKDESPAVRVYTVSDESRYLIVRNVPALGCGNDLLQLFSSYGEVEECKPMDAEDCEQFTDVYWIKFCLFSNARFAKRKLDDFVFLGNRLQVSYAPHFESLSDTKDKLEGRRREVLARLNPRRSKETIASSSRPLITSNTSFLSEPLHTNSSRKTEFEGRPNDSILPKRTVSSNEDYFTSHSMNQTVRIVRDKLDKIESSGELLQAGSTSKKARVDNRRRI